MNLKFNVVLPFLLLLVIPSLVKAQQNYHPGYIITLQQDTLHGFIYYKNWGNNPEAIHFRSALHGKDTYYTPLTITGFGVLNDRYKSAIVQRERRSNALDQLQENMTPDLVKDTTFLQLLFDGKLRLYYFKNNDGINQFYVETGSTPDLLLYKKFLKYKDGKKFVMENKPFVSQLATLMGDCEGIINKLTGIDYSEKDLYQLFNTYHECTHSAITFRHEPVGLKVKAGILVGMSSTKATFEGIDFYLAGIDFKPTNAFSAGLSIAYLLPRAQDNWELHTDLVYSTYNISGQYDFHSSLRTYEVGLSSINVMLLLRYKQALKSTHLFLDGGLASGMPLKTTNYDLDESIFHPPIEGHVFASTRSIELGWVFGAGLGYKDYTLQAKYMLGNGLSPYLDLKSPTKRIFLLLGYNF